MAFGTRSRMAAHRTHGIAFAVSGSVHDLHPKKHLRLTAHHLRRRLHRLGRVNRARKLLLTKQRTFAAV